jgi:hypothetical protein
VNPRRLPFAPLRVLVEQRCFETVTTSAGFRRRFKVAPSDEVRLAWQAARNNKVGTVSCEAGDLMSVKFLGLHPSAVWGDDWWKAAILPLPTRGGRWGGTLTPELRDAVAAELLRPDRDTRAAIAARVGCSYEQVRSVDRQLCMLDDRPVRTKAAA